MNDRIFALAGAINLAAAVAAGALGAHALRMHLDTHALAQWQTAVTYHSSHALGLLLISALLPRFSSRLMQPAGWLLILGLLLFCGSLYLQAALGLQALRYLTPAGGLSFMAAWLLVALAAWRSTRN